MNPNGGWESSSFGANGACIETQWTRSSFCASGSCVECRRNENDFVLVRDSKLGDESPILAFPLATWRAFTEALHDGELTVASTVA